jgi:hypothetical protein
MSLTLNLACDGFGEVSDSPTAPRRARVQLHRHVDDYPPSLLPALEGRWGDLPDRLSVDELNVLAHVLNGYVIASDHLARDAFEVARQLRETFQQTRTWQGNAVELLVGFFAVVRGWRGLYDGPNEGDEQEAQALYEAVRRRLLKHPERKSNSCRLWRSRRAMQVRTRTEDERSHRTAKRRAAPCPCLMTRATTFRAFRARVVRRTRRHYSRSAIVAALLWIARCIPTGTFDRKS